MDKRQGEKIKSLLMSGDKGQINQALSLMDALGMPTTQKNSPLIREVLEYLSDNESMDNDLHKRWQTIIKESSRFKGGVVKHVIDLVDDLVNDCWQQHMKLEKTDWAMFSEKSEWNNDSVFFSYSTDYYGFDMDSDLGKVYVFDECLNARLKHEGLVLTNGQRRVQSTPNKHTFSVQFEIDLTQINFNKLASTRSDTMRKLTKRQASRKLDELYGQLTNKTANLELELKNVEIDLDGIDVGGSKRDLKRFIEDEWDIYQDTFWSYAEEQYDIQELYPGWDGSAVDVKNVKIKSIDIEEMDEDGIVEGSVTFDITIIGESFGNRRARFHEGPKGTKEFENRRRYSSRNKRAGFYQDFIKEALSGYMGLGKGTDLKGDRVHFEGSNDSDFEQIVVHWDFARNVLVATFMSAYDPDDFQSARIENVSFKGGKQLAKELKDLVRDFDMGAKWEGYDNWRLASNRKMTKRQASKKLDELHAKVTRRARFSEGEKGKKEFQKWKSEQSEDFQEEWDENTDKNKKASRKMTPKQASRALDRLHSKLTNRKSTTRRRR